MFKKLFGIGSGDATPTARPAARAAPQRVAQPQAHPGEAALLHQIAERSKTDPLVGAKIGSQELTQRLLAAMKNERGVHTESLLCALGALAGYACQAGLRAQATARGLPESAVFTTLGTKDGSRYFFGDLLNAPLAESQYSVWSIAGGGAQEAGCTQLPDLQEMFQHVSTVMGSAEFGWPRMPAQHKPADFPINYVRGLWPQVQPLIAKMCPNPEHWHILVALSIQQVIVMAKPVLDARLALVLVMESAIPMSKVDLGGMFSARRAG